MPRDALVPAAERIFGWIESVVARGVRRPGYPADRWAERWIAEELRALGLEHVRAEPVELPCWEPVRARLAVDTGDGRWHELAAFALPHSAPVARVEAPLVAWDAADPARVRGAIALQDMPLLRVPHAAMAELATWTYDPGGTFADTTQVLPFPREFMGVMDAAIAAEACGFVGVLADYPGDSKDYYVPYDAIARPLPGVWIRGSDGVALRRLLDRGPVTGRLDVESTRHSITSHNVVGELPGADDQTVVVGSHHDAPWASAVEDGSGIALVLAQAAYWARVPASARPHRLVFLLNAGHMAGGAGTKAFIAAHREALADVVLEVHLEHAASELAADASGRLAPTGRPEARWWFTTRVERLEHAVRAAIEAEGLARSLVLPPDVFGPHPTTDGGLFHLEGVPLVNYLTAPFYLFDAMDTLDKIHRESLVPVTRAAIRVIESTAGVSASDMRGR